MLGVTEVTPRSGQKKVGDRLVRGIKFVRTVNLRSGKVKYTYGR